MVEISIFVEARRKSQSPEGGIAPAELFWQYALVATYIYAW